jgi:hypothetical protein
MTIKTIFSLLVVVGFIGLAIIAKTEGDYKLAVASLLLGLANGAIFT